MLRFKLVIHLIVFNPTITYFYQKAILNYHLLEIKLFHHLDYSIPPLKLFNLTVNQPTNIHLDQLFKLNENLKYNTLMQQFHQRHFMVKLLYK
jgi:hypothetical protein